MVRYIFTILFIVGTTGLADGQSATDSTENKFIEKYPDKFFVWPVIKRRSLSFDISSGNQKHSYKPNNSFSLGLGVYLFEIAAQLTFDIPVNEKNQSTYGTTDTREFNANFLGNGWGLDVFRQKYKGFYFPSSSKVSPAFIKRPDIELINTGVNGIFVFDRKKFSLKSAYNYSERQIKSSGSFIVTGNLNTLQLHADSVILNQPDSQPPASSDFQLLRVTTLSLAGGYTYTLVYRSFFLNGALSIGPAHNWILYSRPDEQANYDIAINTFNDIRVSLGYNSDRFFGGISLVSQSRNIRFDEVRFANTNTIARLLLGYRFREVGILKKRAKDLYAR